MSVQPGPTFKRYAANGVATVYTIPFLLIDDDDLQITLNGLPVTSGFVITGIGDPESTCTFSVAPTGDLLFQLVVQFQRLNDYQENGDFLAGTVNRDFDRIWQALKNLQRDSGRTIRVTPLEPEVLPTFPVVSERANKFMSFDENGDPLAIVPSADSVIDLTQRLQNATDPTLGSGMIGHAIDATGQAGRTVRDKLHDLVSASDFAASGITDWGVAINAAITYLGGIGGGVVNLPRGRLNVATTIVNRYSGVLVRGAGSGNEHDVVGAVDAPTGLLWTGAAGGTMIDFAPTSDAAGRRISGGGFVGIGLYGQSSAATGLLMRSVANADIDLYVEGFTTVGADFNVVATLGEAKDLRDCRIRVNGKQVEATHGILWRIGGDSSANVCYNEMHLRGLYKSATAFVCGNSDNNEIWQWSYRFGGGTGKGIECLGGASDLLCSRANTWHQLYAGDGGVYIYGTSDGYTVASTRNRCLDWDNDNSQPEPVIGTGGTFSKIDKDQRLTWTECGLERTAQNQLHFYGGSGTRLLRLAVTPGATAYWSLSHGAGSVAITANSDTLSDVGMGFSTRGTGTGDFYSSNFSAKRFSWSSVGLSFNGAAIIAKPTVTGAKGGNAALTSLMTALANLGLVTDSTT
ncbi:hypothetical protein [Pseudomonas solani]|uniref:hypothetical protein n=1 Tax=Pseudomonas solani TaxID=2731552 RepID=UPI003D6BB59F